MATRRKVDKFVYLYEKDKVKGLFANIELFNSNISNDTSIDEPVEEADFAKTDLAPEAVTVVTTAKSCSCCQVKFDSGKERR